MSCDLTPTAETEMIRIFVKLLAPGIHEVSCGTRLDGSYDLWLHRPPPINLLHDLLSPPDRICDGADGCRNTLSAVELCQLPRRQNARCDQQRTFSTLVHLHSTLLPRPTKVSPPTTLFGTTGRWVREPRSLRSPASINSSP